jgi:riboflavin kinase/FMN adenylyltransferase
MLGRPHHLNGVVVPGDGRGRTIGIPTANIAVTPGTAIPGRGVYAVTVDVRGERHAGVANLGVRPTFGGEDPTVEVHVLDFDRDVYAEEIRVEFVERIRDEHKFESVAALVTQIHADIEAGRRLLARGS